jgi:hypothetical protein
MYGNGNNFLYKFVNKKMNYIPEGLTPYEIDINPQLLQLWSLSIATKNVEKAAFIFENDFEEIDYRREIYGFVTDLKSYKKTLRKAIHQHFKT